MGRGSIISATLSALATCLVLTTGVRAQTERPLTALETAGWQAVGRVNIGMSVVATTCTGTLVAPTLVLTAGHCAPTVGEDHPGLLFLPGYRADTPLERLPVAIVARHPERGETLSRDTIPFDLGRITLASETSVTPMRLGPPPEVGEALQIISYRNAFLDAPMLTTDCTVLEITRRLVTLDCPVFGGMSGAPVIRNTSAGIELAAIIIATGGDISFAAVPDEWTTRAP